MAASASPEQPVEAPTAETVAHWLRLLLAPKICREPAEFFIERKFIHDYRQEVPEYSQAAQSWPSHAAKHWATVGPLVRKLFATPRTFNFVQWVMEYARVTHPKIYGAEAETNDDILDLTDALCYGHVSPLHIAAAFGLEAVCLDLISMTPSTSESGFFGCPLLCALAGPQAFTRKFDTPSAEPSLPGQKARRAIISSLLTSDAKSPKPYSRMSKHWEALIALGFNASITSEDRSIIQHIIRGGVDIGSLHNYLGEDRLGAFTSQERVETVLSGVLDLFLVSSTLGLSEEDRQDTIGCLADTFNGMLAAHTREDLELTDAEFEEALQDAMIEDNVLCFSRLTHDARFNPNSASRTITSSGTLVHSAVCDNLVDITDMMIDAGGSLEARDDKGRTPLLLSNSVDMMSVLVNQHGASTKSVDYNGRNIWHYIAATADLALLMWLASQDRYKSENLRARNKDGYTPLDEAFRYGLLSIETNDNRTDLGTGNTALVIQLLLVNGAEYSKSINGIPVTHVATIWGLPKIVQTLALHGADFSVTDGQGRSALHYLTLLASTEHVSVLQQLCAGAPITDNDGSTPAETIFLSTAVLDSDGRVKENAYPFSLDEAVYEHLLVPQVLSSRDRQGRTLWERFCAKVVPLSFVNVTDAVDRPYQENWNNAISKALRILRQNGACRDYEEATGQPAVAALELGMRPHNYQWMFSFGLLQDAVNVSDPKLLKPFLSGPAAQRYLVESLLLWQMAATKFLICQGVPTHIPHEKLDGMTALEYVLDTGMSELVDSFIANAEAEALNSRVEEICNVLGEQPYHADSILTELVKRGFAPQLRVPGSHDEAAILKLIGHIEAFDPESNIVETMQAEGLNVASLGSSSAEPAPMPSAGDVSPQSAADITAQIFGNSPPPDATTASMRNMFGHMLSTMPTGQRSSSRVSTPSRSGTPGSPFSDPAARLRRHRALGRTALHVAVVNRNVEAVQELLDMGAADRADHEGRTARTIAIEEGFDDVLEIFEDDDARRSIYNL